MVTKSLFVLNVLSSPYAQKDVMWMMIRLAKVVNIIRANERDINFLCDWWEPLINDALFLYSLELHFEKEVLATQNVAV
jgi:hypothetical protein